MYLTACMIVKNEEKMLPDCLNSLSGVIKELCIVDTGSTDKTIEIIKSFEKMNPSVKVNFKQEQWVETDFSKFRNISLSLISPKTELILIIDADEKIDFDFPKEKFNFLLDKLIKERSFSALAITLRDWQNNKKVMTCGNTRIFKPGVKYVGKIHNRAILKEKDKVILIGGVYINHYGYDLSSDKMKLKFERTTNALMDQLKEPELYPSAEFYLCQSYGTMNLLDDAIKWGEKYLSKDLDQENFNPSIYYTLARMYFEKDNDKRTLELIIEGQIKSLDDIDLALLKCDLLYKQGKIFEMSLAAREYITYYQNILKNGLTGKFYFTFHEELVGLVFMRMSLGFLTEGLSSMSAMIANPHTPEDSITEFKKQLNDWKLGHLWDVVYERTKTSMENQARS